MFMSELNEIAGREAGYLVSQYHRLARVREMHDPDEIEDKDEGYAPCRKHEDIYFVRPDGTAVRS